MARSTLAMFFRKFCMFCLIAAFAGSNSKDDDDNIVFQAGNDNIPQFGVANGSMRYLIYDVNPGEGFNLRRDVYIRMANLVRLLNEKEPWTLVLPPWGHMYHWRNHDIDQSQIPWKTFFDLDSLSKLVPVMEFEDFLKETGTNVIEETYYLQHYKEGWTDGKWEEKMDERECIEDHGFEKVSDDKWTGYFWGFHDVYTKSFKCISIQMEYETFKPFLLTNTTASVEREYTMAIIPTGVLNIGQSIFVHRAESLIHGMYSEWSHIYWLGRRSMRFAKHLRDIGDEFRKKELDSTDEKDQTVLDDDWRNMKRKHGDAKGGPYLAVHLRRRDFLYAHKEDVPSLKETAAQIEKALKENKLKTVFIATDAPTEEYDEIKKHLSDYKVTRYTPTKEVKTKYMDGGVAIIDQWICTHARYFMGTSVSTFTFRIHEEREILGFSQESTYNRFCGDNQKKECEQPTKWEIKYD